MRKVFLLILVASLLSSFANAQPPATTDKPKQDKPKGLADAAPDRVMEALADYTINYDMLEKARYAVVARGAGARVLSGADVHEREICLLAAHEDKRELYCSMQVVWSNLNPDHESWEQKLLADGKIYRRDEPRSPFPAKVYNSDEEYRDDEFQQHIALLRPLDLPLQSTNSLHPTSKARSTRIHERFLSEIYTLGNAEFRDDRNLEARFDVDTKGIVRVDVVFGHKVDYMPIDTRYYILFRGKQKFVAHTQTKWKRFGKLWLPIEVDGMNENPPMDGSHTTRHTISLQWKIGDQLGRDPILDPKAEDWREPIRVLFDQEWSRPNIPRPPNVFTPNPFLEKLKNAGRD